MHDLLKNGKLYLHEKLKITISVLYIIDKEIMLQIKEVL